MAKKGKEQKSVLEDAKDLLALQVLFYALIQDEVMSYDNEDEESPSIGKNKKVNFSLENVSRDIFYSSKSLLSHLKSVVLGEGVFKKEASPEDNTLTIIHNGISYVITEDTFNEINWDDYFDFKNADVVFDYETPENSGAYQSVWIANKEKGWLITCDGFMGEYCDEDYDISADFSFMTGLSTLDFDQILTKNVNKTIEDAVNNFCSTLNGLKNVLPITHQDVVDLALSQSLSKHPIAQLHIAQEEKRVIKENIATTPSKPPTPKKKI